MLNEIMARQTKGQPTPEVGMGATDPPPPNPRGDPMGHFVDDFDPADRRAALIWARDDFDPHDGWGWVMSWLFDIAGELHRRDEAVPPELHYRPSPFGPDISEERAEGLAEIDTDALTHAARVLHRYEMRQRAAGNNY